MMRSNCLRWASSSVHSRSAGSGSSGVGACSLAASRYRKGFLEALNVEIAGGEVTGGGDKAAIGWDVVDVLCTVKTAIDRTVVSVCLALGKKFGEKL